MGIVASGAYALSAVGIAEGWKPVIGWHDLVTADNLTATVAAGAYPVTNLTTPRTNSLWKAGATTNPQYLTCLFGAEHEVDYLGLARHNLGSAQVATTIQGLPFGGDPEDDGDWTELFAEQLLANNTPALFRYTPTGLIGVRARLEPGATAPQAAVLKIGKLIVLENGLPPGHVPITYGLRSQISSPRSQGGDHMGRTVLGGSLHSTIQQVDLDPDWYRDTLEPFRAASRTDTFFWSWAPQDYAAEVGYCEVTNDPQPVVNQTTGHISINFEIAGIDL